MVTGKDLLWIEGFFFGFFFFFFFGGGGIFGQVSDLRTCYGNSTNNKDATRMLGMNFVACGSPVDTCP